MTRPGGRPVGLATQSPRERAGQQFWRPCGVLPSWSPVLRAYAHDGADGADGEPSTLYWIEPATLEATRIGPVGYALDGIARGHDDGNLYGVTSSTDPRTRIVSSSSTSTPARAP